jgi:hypothetical protein
MREIRGNERFGNIVQTGKRDVLRTTAQSTKRALHRGVAKHSIQSFANGGKNHAGVSDFHARGGSAFADFSKNRRCGVTRDNWDGNDVATRGFYFFAAHDLIAGPVAALYKYIWKQTRNDFARRRLIENHYCVHAFEPRENFGAFAFRQNGAPSALQLAHARVAVKANDQRVTKSASLLQAPDVPWMQQIEAPVRKDDAAPVAFLAPKPQNRFVESQNLRLQRNSMKSQVKIAPALDENLVYHAPHAKRLRAGHCS